MKENAKDLSDVEYLMRNVTTIGSVQITHKVVLYKKPMKGSNKPVEYVKKNCSSFTLAGRMGHPSYIYRETRDYILLQESIFGKLKGDEKPDFNALKNKPRASAALSYGDVDNIKMIFDSASRWFTEEKYRNTLFLYDKSGVPYGISARYESLCTLTNLLSGSGSFLSIQPTVVLDALNGIGYPGVIFKSNNGVIGTCTVSEFFALKRILIHLLDNLYMNTLCLINHYLSIKQGEVEEYVVY